MGLKPAILISGALLAVGCVAMADEYRPDEFLGLDLSKAVMSPKPIGPPAHFAAMAPEANSDAKSDRSEADMARDELKIEPPKVKVQDVKLAVRDVRGAHPHRLMHAAAEKPKGAARIRLAHRHRNPLDAQALDTRIQKWPCHSGGGICGWK